MKRVVWEMSSKIQKSRFEELNSKFQHPQIEGDNTPLSYHIIIPLTTLFLIAT